MLMRYEGIRIIAIYIVCDNSLCLKYPSFFIYKNILNETKQIRNIFKSI